MVTAIDIEPADPADMHEAAGLLQAADLPLDGFADHFDQALVARHDGRLIGCATLELYRPYALLRSLAVEANYRGQGIGEALTRAILDKARQQQLEAIYLLTETAAEFFPRFGFSAVERARVPESVKRSVEFTSACPASALAMTVSL